MVSPMAPGGPFLRNKEHTTTVVLDGKSQKQRLCPKPASVTLTLRDKSHYYTSDGKIPCIANSLGVE